MTFLELTDRQKWNTFDYIKEQSIKWKVVINSPTLEISNTGRVRYRNSKQELKNYGGYNNIFYYINNVKTNRDELMSKHWNVNGPDEALRLFNDSDYEWN